MKTDREYAVILMALVASNTNKYEWESFSERLLTFCSGHTPILLENHVFKAEQLIRRLEEVDTHNS